LTVFDDILEELEDDSDLEGIDSVGSDETDALSDYSDAFSLTIDPVSAESSLWDVYGEFAGTPHAGTSRVMISGRSKASTHFNIPSEPQSPAEALHSGRSLEDALLGKDNEYRDIPKTVSLATGTVMLISLRVAAGGSRNFGKRNYHCVIV
jgi:hypothetical protein